MVGVSSPSVDIEYRSEATRSACWSWQSSSAASARPAGSWDFPATDTVLPVKRVDLRRPFARKDASVLAPVKDEARPAARWPSAILDLRGARRQCRRPIGTAG